MVKSITAVAAGVAVMPKRRCENLVAVRALLRHGAICGPSERMPERGLQRRAASGAELGFRAGRRASRGVFVVCAGVQIRRGHTLQERIGFAGKDRPDAAEVPVCVRGLLLVGGLRLLNIPVAIL